MKNDPLPVKSDDEARERLKEFWFKFEQVMGEVYDVKTSMSFKDYMEHFK